MMKGYKTVHVFRSLLVSFNITLLTEVKSVKFSKMNWLVLAALLSAACFATAEHYTDRYDNINYDEILENKRLLEPYLKCVLDKGRCTAEGKELKAHLKDAMQTGCEKCTQKQRVGARKVVAHIKSNEKDYWEQIKAKYDPGDKLKETYEAFLAAKE